MLISDAFQLRRGREIHFHPAAPQQQTLERAGSTLLNLKLDNVSVRCGLATEKCMLLHKPISRCNKLNECNLIQSHLTFEPITVTVKAERRPSPASAQTRKRLNKRNRLSSRNEFARKMYTNENESGNVFSLCIRHLPLLFLFRSLSVRFFLIA